MPPLPTPATALQIPERWGLKPHHGPYHVGDGVLSPNGYGVFAIEHGAAMGEWRLRKLSMQEGDNVKHRHEAKREPCELSRSSGGSSGEVMASMLGHVALCRRHTHTHTTMHTSAEDTPNAALCDIKAVCEAELQQQDASACHTSLDAAMHQPHSRRPTLRASW